jgi:hypothetical protein
VDTKLNQYYRIGAIIKGLSEFGRSADEVEEPYVCVEELYLRSIGEHQQSKVKLNHFFIPVIDYLKLPSFCLAYLKYHKLVLGLPYARLIFVLQAFFGQCL